MVVYELMKWQAPRVLILLTLLVKWNTQLPHDIDPQFEFDAIFVSLPWPKKIDSNITEMVGIPFFMFGCLRKNPRIVTLLKSSLVVARSHELCVKWLGLTHKHKHKYL